jgi:thioesterase domain-containing protein
VSGLFAFAHNYLQSWAFTARQLCLCIEDGIRKLASGPFWLYVPDFDWPEVASRLGVAPVFKHLIKETLDGPDATADGESIEDIVARHLDVARQDMTAERPLTAYGLDSLSAARLAIALRHHTRVTQLQLLGDMSVTDLYRHAEKNAPETAAKPGALFDWTNLNAAGHTVVKCVGQETEEANPLILMHGTSGNGAAFTPLQPQFSTPFWFLQCTPETPFASMDALVAFYVAEIKRARPHGPYRLGTYCATCNIALELVRVLEAQGDEVVQFVFIDFVPTMFCRPAFALGAAALRNRALGEEDMTRWFRIVLDSFDPNSAMDVQNRAMMEATWTGALTSNQFMVNYCAYFRRLVAVIVPDLVAAAAGADEADSAAFYAALWAGLCARMRAVRAPKTVWLARDGLVTAMDEPIERWDEMGIRPGDVFRCGGGHKSMFFEEDFARGIEFPGQQHT